jgi:hypothetical protein
LELAGSLGIQPTIGTAGVLLASLLLPVLLAALLLPTLLPLLALLLTLLALLVTLLLTLLSLSLLSLSLLLPVLLARLLALALTLLILLESALLAVLALLLAGLLTGLLPLRLSRLACTFFHGLSPAHQVAGSFRQFGVRCPVPLAIQGTCTLLHLRVHLLDEFRDLLLEFRGPLGHRGRGDEVLRIFNSVVQLPVTNRRRRVAEGSLRLYILRGRLTRYLSKVLIEALDLLTKCLFLLDDVWNRLLACACLHGKVCDSLFNRALAIDGLLSPIRHIVDGLAQLSFLIPVQEATGLFERVGRRLGLA